MRILLAANASYVPPRGGATRSNLAWLDALASRGHACSVVASALADGRDRLEQMREEGIEPTATCVDGVEVVRRGETVIYSAAEAACRGEVLRGQIREFQPDWVLVSSEDIGQLLLREAHRSAPGRVVYLAHTPQFFPFGPESWNPDEHGADLVARSAGIIAIGRHMAAYIERHLGRSPAIIHPPIYGSGPFANYGCFEGGLISMINPCAVKGISVFLALAERFPDLLFGAVPGWGTTSADRRALASRANVEVLPNRRTIDDLLSGTRVLLMPSLWYEGFGLIVVEAMLRGIPVISSDSGGLRDAKLGTGFLVPAPPLERYDPVYDERGMPRPVTGPPNLDAWTSALARLLSDAAVYYAESEASRRAALQFVESVRPTGLEEFLTQLEPAPFKTADVGRLPPETRARLLEKLRSRHAVR